MILLLDASNCNIVAISFKNLPISLRSQTFFFKRKCYSFFLFTFANEMKKTTIEQRRRCYSRILLGVFVPMLLLAAFHWHNDETGKANACVECVHHVPHSGHLTAQSFSVDDCLLCQFHALPYLPATVVMLVALLPVDRMVYNLSTVAVESGQSSCISLRGPPICF